MALRCAAFCAAFRCAWLMGRKAFETRLAERERREEQTETGKQKRRMKKRAEHNVRAAGGTHDEQAYEKLPIVKSACSVARIGKGRDERQGRQTGETRKGYDAKDIGERHRADWSETGEIHLMDRRDKQGRQSGRKESS